MPNNQVATPKGMLLSQAEIPKVALSATPLAALGLGITGVLSTIASALPEAPALPAAIPGLPTLPRVSAAPQIPVISEFIKSVEWGLPTALPRLSQVAPGATEVSPAPAKAPELVFE